MGSDNLTAHLYSKLGTGSGATRAAPPPRPAGPVLRQQAFDGFALFAKVLLALGLASQAFLILWLDFF
jgi:hypothetical protein